MTAFDPAASRHARFAVAAYAASLATVAMLGASLAFGNLELQGEHAAKVQLLDGLRRTGVDGGTKAPTPAAQSAALQAATETLAASELQKQIVDRLRTAGAFAQSVQAEPMREAAAVDGLQRLTAKLTFDGSIATLQRLLFDLETGLPFMFVDTLAVQPTSVSTAGAGAEDRLRVTLVMSAYWTSNAKGRAAP